MPGMTALNLKLLFSNPSNGFGMNEIDWGHESIEIIECTYLVCLGFTINNCLIHESFRVLHTKRFCLIKFLFERKHERNERS